MHHTIPLLPKFYVTAPQPCPYLEGQLERKLFTSIQGNNATKVNNILSKQGFRRSQMFCIGLPAQIVLPAFQQELM